MVFQGSERGTGCQFTFTCDGSLVRTPSPVWWERARRVARAALAGAVFAPIGLATHYHTMQVHPAWSDALIRVATIGAHQFFRLPGAAGQALAFHAAYLGGEPAAVPHPRQFTPAIDSAPDPVVLARAYDAAVSTAIPLKASAVMSPGRLTIPQRSRRAGAMRCSGPTIFPAAAVCPPQLERSGQWLQHP